MLTGELAPPPWGSPGSATGNISYYRLVSVTVFVTGDEAL